MKRSISSIWQRLPSDLASRTERCIEAACERLTDKKGVYVFFRADDVAAPGNQFACLLDMFFRHRVPLCLAVVPAWLTRPRWQVLSAAGNNCAALWCWHQHGWRHANHETGGKKQEFGPSRTRDALEHDIRCGRQHLVNLMGKNFYPVFTPPWNRCGQEALATLKDLGYRGVSRSRGSRPLSPPGLANFDVNVDLHTRKEGSPPAGWDKLFNELHQAISSGCCGIMIHHRRMNSAAFDFLDILLKSFKTQNGLQLVHFKDLVYTAS
jgi:hypothetical protein